MIFESQHIWIINTEAKATEKGLTEPPGTGITADGAWTITPQ
jgi:hypothetical protein